MLLKIGLSGFLFPTAVFFVLVSPHCSSTDHAMSLSMSSLWFFWTVFSFLFELYDFLCGNTQVSWVDRAVFIISHFSRNFSRLGLILTQL